MIFDLVIVAGTRPEYLKFKSIFQELSKSNLKWLFVNTGQHKDLWPKNENDNWPTLNLNRTQSGLLNSYSEILMSLQNWYDNANDDLIIKKVMVQGDTFSAWAGASFGFANSIDVVHVEAGMRTDDLKDPFPEEGIRRSIGQLTSHHFVTDQNAKDNLLKEGVSSANIYNCGNTLRDLFVEQKIKPTLNRKKQILVTLHRRDEEAEPYLISLGQKLKRWSIENGWTVLWINHPNQKLKSWSVLNSENFMQLDPCDHQTLVSLLLDSSKVITDSGGLQEEARWLGCPVSLVRNSTEWAEGIAKGEVVLVGNYGQNLLDDLNDVKRIPWVTTFENSKLASLIIDKLKEL